MRLTRRSIHTVLSMFALFLMVTLFCETAVFAQDNTIPIAAAGPDVKADEGSFIQLDGSGSFDPEFGPLTYSWTQIAGPTAVTSNADTAILDIVHITGFFSYYNRLADGLGIDLEE